MSSLKRIFTGVCFLVIFCMILFIRTYSQKNLQRGIFIFWKYNASDVARDTITPLKGNKTFIIAPYYDNRDGNLVRVLGIVHHTVKKLYCHLVCTRRKDLFFTEAVIDVHSDSFGFPFGLADIDCHEPLQCKASHIYIVESPDEDLSVLPRFKIRNREQGQFLANFTVCISTMYGNYNNILQFIQTIEMYKLLGAQRVTIYVNNRSQQVKAIMDYYSQIGVLEVVPWPIQKYLRTSNRWYYKGNSDNTDLGYYGQVSTLNDCLYKNMYRSKYVLLNDLDEIILPFKHMTWDSMMEELQRENPSVGVFLFENHNFPQTAVTDERFPNISSWKDVPGYNLLNHVHREPDRPDVFNSRKMIVDPRKVLQTSVHSVLKSFADSLNVPLQTALVHHCRRPRQPNLSRSQLIEDRTIWKYNVSLIKNVNQVLSQWRRV